MPSVSGEPGVSAVSKTEALVTADPEEGLSCWNQAKTALPPAGIVTSKVPTHALRPEAVEDRGVDGGGRGGRVVGAVQHRRGGGSSPAGTVSSVMTQRSSAVTTVSPLLVATIWVAPSEPTFVA